MRVLYSHYLESDDHPAVRMVQAIADQLRHRGHEVLVHASAGPAAVGAPRPSNGGGGLRGKLWFVKALARNRARLRRDLEALRTFRPDVVLARQDAYCWSMPAAARRESVPLVTYADAPVAYETRLYSPPQRWHPPGLVESIERYTLRQSRAVVTVSHTAARLLGLYGCAAPIRVAWNGVDPERFPAIAANERQARRQILGLKAENVVVFQGSFRPFHGLDLLRQVIRATAGRSDTQWLLIGDGPERAALQAELSGKAVFLGHCPPDMVGRLLTLADIAVVPQGPSIGEYYFCPLKLLECAAAGCAIVSGAQGDVPLLLDYGRRGVIVPARSNLESAWVSALNSLLDDPQRRRELGERARAAVLSQLTWAHTAQAVEHVLRGALGPLSSGHSLSPISGFSLSRS